MTIAQRLALLTGGFFFSALAAQPAFALIIRTPTVLKAQTSTSVIVRMPLRSSRRIIRLKALTQRPVVTVRSSSSSPAPRSSLSGVGSSSSAASRARDPMTDATLRSNFLLLSETSPVMAGVRVFSQHEPISVTKITVQLLAEAPSVESFLIYDQDQLLLGTATQVSGFYGRYAVTLPVGVLSAPKKVPVSLYARARVKPHSRGGWSAESVQVSSVTVEGTGDWSGSTTYVEATTETFPGFETARGMPTVIRNNSIANSVLSVGTNKLLAEFRFEGRKTDEEATIRLTSLRFIIESDSTVTLSNARLRVEGLDTPYDCTVASGAVTCSSLPASIGSLDSPRVIRVFGDVAVTGGAQSPFLRLTLNDPGSISASGDISWTDGEANFSWVPFEQPVASGTLMR